MWNVALYLEMGIVSDILVTGYYCFVSRGWAYLAASISIPIALLTFWVLRFLDPTPLDALAYAFGNAIGCLLIMKAFPKREDIKKTG